MQQELRKTTAHKTWDREKASRPLLTLHGMMDEQFLVSLHRGQEGRALKENAPWWKDFRVSEYPY
jgi:site-specific DNA recombinase